MHQASIKKENVKTIGMFLLPVSTPRAPMPSCQYCVPETECFGMLPCLKIDVLVVIVLLFLLCNSNATKPDGIFAMRQLPRCTHCNRERCDAAGRLVHGGCRRKSLGNHTTRFTKERDPTLCGRHARRRRRQSKHHTPYVSPRNRTHVVLTFHSLCTHFRRIDMPNALCDTWQTTHNA